MTTFRAIVLIGHNAAANTMRDWGSMLVEATDADAARAQVDEIMAGVEDYTISQLFETVAGYE